MKILILNVHSALNLGDQGIMQATLEALRAEFPDAKIAVAANHPQSWRDIHDPLYDVEHITVVGSLTSWVEQLRDGRWKSQPVSMIGYLALLAIAALGYRLFGKRLMWGTTEQRHLLNAYYDADLALSCGGGNLYAYRRLSPLLLWNLCALIFALSLGKKLILLPQSFGPIPGGLQRRMTHWILSRATMIAARESWSHNYVSRDLQVQAPVHLLPDLAFGMARTGLPPRPADRPVQIGVTTLDRGAQLRSFAGQSAYEDTICTVLSRLAHERGAEITLFCQCYGPSVDQDDRPATKRIHKRLTEAGVKTTLWTELNTSQQALDAYANMDLMIGTRMHTAIFAICNATPILLVGYQPKGYGVMAMCGLERYCCDITQLSAADLVQRAVELLDHQAELKTFLTTQRSELKIRSIRWTQVLSGLVC